MKSKIFICLLVLAALMDINTTQGQGAIATLNFRSKSDMVGWSSIPQDGQVCILSGESTSGDGFGRYYWFNNTSTATADGESIVLPTAVGGSGNPGRWIKSFTFNAGSISAGNGISVSGTSPNQTVNVIQPTINQPSRATGTGGWTISATQWALGIYTVTCTSTNPLLSGTSSSVFNLEYSTNAGSSWIAASDGGNSNAVSLTVTVQLTNGQTGVLVGVTPKNALTRVRVTNTGTASGSISKSTEILFW